MGPLRSAFAAIGNKPLIWIAYSLIQVAMMTGFVFGCATLLAALRLPKLTESGSGFATRTLPVWLLVGFAASAMGFLLSICAYRLAIQQLRGEPQRLPRSAEMPRLIRAVALIAVPATAYNTVVSIVAVAATDKWDALWIENGLWVAFAPPFAFVLPLIADVRISPTGAIRNSLRAWLAHPLQIHLYVLVLLVASMFGVACIVGLAVTLAIYPLGIASLYVDYLEIVGPERSGHT